MRSQTRGGEQLGLWDSSDSVLSKHLPDGPRLMLFPFPVVVAFQCPFEKAELSHSILGLRGNLLTAAASQRLLWFSSFFLSNFLDAKRAAPEG